MRNSTSRSVRHWAICLAALGFVLLAGQTVLADTLDPPATANEKEPGAGMTYALLVLVMILSGLAGGTVNYAMTHTPGTGSVDWLKRVTAGLGASFLTPLFLKMISSDLVTSIFQGNAQGEILVFTGFSLLAAISSRAFIETLSDKVLSEARDARLKAERASSEVTEIQTSMRPIVDVMTEQDDGSIDPSATAAPLSELESLVLDAVSHGNFLLRSPAGIAADAGIDVEAVETQLKSLSTEQLVAPVRVKSGVRWTLTAAGRERLSDEARRKETQRVALREKVRRLPEPHQTVIRYLVFQEDTDPGELAEQLDVSEEEIGILYGEALDQLDA